MKIFKNVMETVAVLLFFIFLCSVESIIDIVFRSMGW